MRIPPLKAFVHPIFLGGAPGSAFDKFSAGILQRIGKFCEEISDDANAETLRVLMAVNTQCVNALVTDACKNLGYEVLAVKKANTLSAVVYVDGDVHPEAFNRLHFWARSAFKPIVEEVHASFSMNPMVATVQLLSLSVLLHNLSYAPESVSIKLGCVLYMSFVKFLVSVSESKARGLHLCSCRSDLYGDIEEGRFQELLESTQFPCLEVLEIHTSLLFNPVVRPFLQRMLGNVSLRSLEIVNED